MFNTLKYSRILEATGISREQAEAHVQIMAEIVEDEVATKQDIRETKQEIKETKQEIKSSADGMRQEIKSSTDGMRQEIEALKSKIDQMEDRLILRLIAILVPVTSLTIAIMTFIMKKI